MAIAPDFHQKLDCLAESLCSCGAFRMLRPTCGSIKPFELNLACSGPTFNYAGKLPDLVVVEMGEMLYDAAFQRATTQVRSLRWIAGWPEDSRWLAWTINKIAREGTRDVPQVDIVRDVESQMLRLIESHRGKFGGPTALATNVLYAGEEQIQAVDALAAGGYQVKCVLAVVDCLMGGSKALIERGIAVTSLFTVSELVDTYVRRKCVTPAERLEISEYLTLVAGKE